MFKLSKKSRENLVGVDARLVHVVEKTIEITHQDFRVTCGLRTKEEQERLYALGKTKRKDGLHLRGEAVDLVPWCAAGPLWEVELCCIVARAITTAALSAGVRVRWGGAWQVLAGRDPAETLAAYVARRMRLGRRPFVDAVHYELA